MNKYLQDLADQEIPLKDKLTSVQLKKALDIGITFADYTDAIRMFKFKRYIKAHQFDAATKRYVLDDPACLRYFHYNVESQLNLSKGDYTVLPDGVIGMKPTAFDRVFNKVVEELLAYLNSEKGRKEYQQALQKQFIDNLKAKYCGGSISTWEMDTLTCYQHEHELAKVDARYYNICNFNELPEIAASDNDIVAIAGTVIDTVKLKHLVSLLTVYGVVDVKLSGPQFIKYNQRLTTVDPNTKKKTVIDESWFKRGTKLIVYGQRRNNVFSARSCRIDGFFRYIGRIEEVHTNGTIKAVYSRHKTENGG